MRSKPSVPDQHLCGDALIQWPEQCDDGWPPGDGDGCSSQCIYWSQVSIVLAIQLGVAIPHSAGGHDLTIV